MALCIDLAELTKREASHFFSSFWPPLSKLSGTLGGGMASVGLWAGNCSQGVERSNFLNSWVISMGSHTTRFTSSSYLTWERGGGERKDERERKMYSGYFYG